MSETQWPHTPYVLVSKSEGPVCLVTVTFQKPDVLISKPNVPDSTG
jgi:hypothetical protein